MQRQPEIGQGVADGVEHRTEVRADDDVDGAALPVRIEGVVGDDREAARHQRPGEEPDPGVDLDGQLPGLVQERLGRPGHHQPAGVEHEDVVADPGDVVEQVGGQQHRDPERRQPAHQRQAYAPREEGKEHGPGAAGRAPSLLRPQQRGDHCCRQRRCRQRQGHRHRPERGERQQSEVRDQENPGIGDGGSFRAAGGPSAITDPEQQAEHDPLEEIDRNQRDHRREVDRAGAQTDPLEEVSERPDDLK